MTALRLKIQKGLTRKQALGEVKKCLKSAVLARILGASPMNQKQAWQH